MKQLSSLLFRIIFLLFLNACGGGSSSNNENTPPIANAGADQNVITTSTVTLDGSSSSDINSDTLTYSWSITSTPNGSTAALSDATIVNPTFIVDLDGSYVLQLIVNDGTVDSAADSLTITAAANSAPIADAGADQYVFTTSIVTLDGSSSNDEHSDTLTYSWSITSTPNGSTAALSDTTIVDPTFIADLNGSYVLQLIVNDGTVSSAANSVTITAATFSDVQAHDPTFESLYFSGSQNCATCHNSQTDSITGEDVSIVNAWESTMMANAAIDPLYLAKVASEVKRNPDFKEVIEEKCSRCHMPMANVEAGFAGDKIAMSGDGFLNPDNTYHDAAKEGVSCTLCHQIEDDPKLGTEEGFSGGFVIDENTDKPNREIYGQFNDMKPGKVTQMQDSADFIPTYSLHMTNSKLCASCHNLNTPVIDAQGNLSDNLTFPEQAVYTEWEYSDFNDSNVNTVKRCQDCHMPESTNGVVIATGGNLEPRKPFHQHQFIGANTYMLDIIKNNRTKLGAIADTASFDTTITNTKEFLKAAADVNITTTGFANGTLAFSVKVTNHSGHKFPTSIPTRRAWLHVKVTNTTGQTVFESGALNNTRQIIGVDDEDGYEEHHEKIDDDSEVQVYEPIMADTDGNQTYTFMQASRYLKDNRILPKGFRNDTPANAKPYGEAVEDNDFVGGSDTVEYEVDNIPNDDYTISVTLRYQTVSYGFMQDLYRDVNLTEVALMQVLDSNTENYFESISTDTFTYTP